MKRVFLDNAATTTLHPAVIEAMVEAMDGRFGNPSSIHAEGRAARAALEQARKTVARFIGASIGEVFFTSGGTESNNMALKCAVRDLGVVRIISSPTEHHCVLHSLEAIERSGKARIDFVNIEAKGHVVVNHLEALLQQNAGKTLVSLMHSNNEIGSMIDLEEIAALCRQYDALFHTDTVQTMGYFPINVSETPISFLSGSAHKFHGPKGVGFIYINKENIVRPFVDGGSQERNMRGGTENFYGIIGLAKALQIACDNMEANRRQVTEVRNYFAAQLKQYIEDVQFNGDPFERGHYKVLSASFPASAKSDLLLLNLDVEGISASGGSACSSGADAGSHVIAALGGDTTRTTVRFSFSDLNTREEVDFAIEKLRKLLPAAKQVAVV